MVGVKGEDAEPLQRIAKAPADLVAELLRDADPSTA
jgi:hypothetical protein